jgi:hypothetical protein
VQRPRIRSGFTERERLPVQIRGSGRGLGRRHSNERTATGARVQEPLLDQAGDRLLDGLRAGSMPRHELADRRQPRPGRRIQGDRTQVRRDALKSVILDHECFQ